MFDTSWLIAVCFCARHMSDCMTTKQASTRRCSFPMQVSTMPSSPGMSHAHYPLAHQALSRRYTHACLIALWRVTFSRISCIRVHVTLFQDVFTQIRVQVCMCYNCFTHLLFFFWYPVFCPVDQIERMSLCRCVYELVCFF